MDTINNPSFPSPKDILKEGSTFSGAGAKPAEADSETNITNDSKDISLYQNLEYLKKYVDIKKGGEQTMTPESVVAEMAIGALYQQIKNLKDKNTQLEANLIEAKNKADELNKKSHTDALTGAYSRNYLDEFLNTEFDEKKERIAVVFMDGVKFKVINDNCGHLVGDDLLKIMASSLIRLGFNKADFLVRAGGDEFIFIYRLPNENNFEESEVTARIEARINSAKTYLEKTFNDYAINNQDKFPKQLNYKPDFSYGIAYSSKGKPMSETLHSADMSMFKNKRANADNPES